MDTGGIHDLITERGTIRQEVTKIHITRDLVTHTPEEDEVNFIVWLIAGALVGWVASNIMRTNRRQGLVMDIVVGIVGAFVAGYFLSPVFGIATINQRDFSLPSLLLSLGGAVVLLAVVNVLRRGRVTG